MRFLLLAVSAFMFAPPVWAAEPVAPEPVAPVSDVYACASIATDAERLACYDTAVGRLKAAEQAGEVTIVDPVKVRQLEKEAFGFSIPSLPRLALPKLGDPTALGDEPGVEEMTFTIERVRPGDKSAFVMTNGQVWKNIDTAKAMQFKAGKTVLIRRASMGSFLMKLDGGTTSIRVKREE